MGDRTTVKLTVLKEQRDAVVGIFEPVLGTASNEEDLGSAVKFEFDEVNYANLGIEADLRAAGIAYDKWWAAGSEYQEGCEYARFNEAGELRNFDVYIVDENPNIDQLIALCDKPNELVRFIQNFKQSVTAGPLATNQIEYGKRYLAKQLIFS